MGFSWEKREHKALQDYVVLPDHLYCQVSVDFSSAPVSFSSFIQVPSNISLPQAASVPDSFVTAWHSLMTELEIPLMDILYPKNGGARKEPPNPKTSFLIWGGATSSGMYAIQVCLYPTPYAP
jgi:NADPH:quinone reductase-like Zn-dependent oxidoreductase